MSSFEFNPFTGTFDIAPRVKAYKEEKVVDAGFLATPNITLESEPVVNSEIVTLNGLEINNTNYSITGSIIVFVVTQIAIGDTIHINYFGCK